MFQKWNIPFFLFSFMFPETTCFLNKLPKHTAREFWILKQKTKKTKDYEGFSNVKASMAVCTGADEFVFYFLSLGLYPILRRCLLKVQLQIVCQQKVEKIIRKPPPSDSSKVRPS